MHPTSSSGTKWFGAISAIHFVLVTFGGTATCEYGGTLNGGNYDNNGGILTLSGSVPKISGNFLCPSNLSLSGTYGVSPTLTLS